MAGDLSLWGVLWWIMLFLYVPSCFALIIIVLLQKGKGMGFGGAFGMGGGGDAVFGPRMARSLPQKLTYAAAAIFMLLALTMSMIGGRVTRGAAPDLAEGVATEQEGGLGESLFDEAPATEDAATEDATGEAAPETTEVVPPEVTVMPVTETPDGAADAAPDDAAETPAEADTAQPAADEAASETTDETAGETADDTASGAAETGDDAGPQLDLSSPEELVQESLPDAAPADAESPAAP